MGKISGIVSGLTFIPLFAMSAAAVGLRAGPSRKSPRTFFMARGSSWLYSGRAPMLDTIRKICSGSKGESFRRCLALARSMKRD